MKGKLKNIFNFLENNRKFNHEVQENYYKSFLLSYETKEEKIISLLYNIANTQSRPKIDELSFFFKSIYNSIDKLTSFNSFVKLVCNCENSNYENLFKGMIKQKGWGNKTSALLCKSIFHIHNGNYSKDLIIWNDAPKKIIKGDQMNLPVDAVIIAIFEKLFPFQKWDFKKINTELKKFYYESQIEIWDDLWFWGFITQKSIKNKRVFEWNENKYWMLKESNKSNRVIEDIKKKSNQFLKLLEK